MAQRIPDSLLEKVAFLYPTEAEAKAGKPTGGCCFFVDVPWETRPEEFAFVYAVTNRHVIEPAKGRSALVIRANLRSGGTDTIVTNVDEWHSPDSDDDIAVRLLAVDPGTFRIQRESVTRVISDEIVNEYNLGIGDEVFSVGRFLDVESDQENRPVLRTGILAAAPPVSVQWHGDKRQNSYLVEMRSRTGFSGSPVYVYIDPSAAGQWVKRDAVTYKTVNLGLTGVKLCGPWILGVHWGQLPTAGPDDTGHGSGITGVVPGQILRRFLLEDENLKKARKAIEDEHNSRPHSQLESANEAAPGDANPNHKEDFTRLLNAAMKGSPSEDQT